MGLTTSPYEWVWTNFTWQNASIPEGTVVGWRICYRDSSGNVNSTDVVSFTIKSNEPPEPPAKPSGRRFGFTHQTYTYTTHTTDPDGDPVYYLWDWGDGTTTSWLGPYASGEIAGASHAWATVGTYQVKVKARDIDGAESIAWSELLYVRIDRAELVPYYPEPVLPD
jgi:hypothetical protein